MRLLFDDSAADREILWINLEFLAVQFLLIFFKEL